MSIVRWLLVAVLAYGTIGARVDAPAAEGVPNRCAPAGPAVPGVTEGASRPGTVAPSVGTIRAAFLYVHASDAPAAEPPAQQHELIDAANAWYRATSYGRLELRAETPPGWLALPGTSRDYAGDPARFLHDAVAAADPLVDFSRIDIVYLATPLGTPVAVPTSANLFGFGTRADGRDVNLWLPLPPGTTLSDTDPYLLVHETGHLLGLPDLYAPRVARTFHRWDVMAARWPAELIAWHRWKLGWLDRSQIVCVTGRGRRVVTLAPLERPGGVKALFVKRGTRVLAIEVRAKLGYDRTICRPGVLVTEIEQAQFKRAPVRVVAARGDRGRDRGCGPQRDAPFGTAKGDVRRLQLSSWGFRMDVLARLPDGSYRVRVVTGR